MKRLHRAYTALAKRGGHDISFSVQEYQQVSLSDLGVARSRILAETQVPKVIPYVAVLANRSPYTWLDAHLVDISQVSFDEGLLATSNTKKLDELSKGGFSSAWELMIKLTVDRKETLDYKAYALKRASGNITVIDAVVLGLELNSHQMKPYHVVPGKNTHSTWIGCRAAYATGLYQPTMVHEENDHSLTAWCNPPAQAKILCDTTKKDCPRITGATILGGKCTIIDPGVKSGSFGKLVAQSSVDTLAHGNCQHSASAMMVYSVPTKTAYTIKWSLELKSKGAAVTPVVTFQEKTPSHAVYQIHLATLCCQREKPNDAGVDPTPDYGATKDAATKDAATMDVATKDAGVDGGPFQKCKGLTPSKCVLCCEVEAKTDAEFNTCVKLHC